MRESVAIDRALEFLRTEQLVSGQFPMEYTLLENPDAPTGAPQTYPEKSPFVSSCIAHSLGYCRQESAAAMVKRVAEFLVAEESAGGLWRYWCKDAPLHGQIPPDVDDTACISAVLRDVQGRKIENRELLLSNTDDRGLFYTWIIPRPTTRATIGWWKAVLGDVTWGRAVSFWRAGANRDDVDPVVNANAVFYLGADASTARAIEWLLGIAKDEDEDASDKWYRSAPAFYYAVSRCYARGVVELRAAGENLVRRYARLSHADGRIGNDSLQTAMAVCSLINFDFPAETYRRANDYLMTTQCEDGGWPSHPVYYDGRSFPRIQWESRSVTTGFCIEALVRQGGTAS